MFNALQLLSASLSGLPRFAAELRTLPPTVAASYVPDVISLYQGPRPTDLREGIICVVALLLETALFEYLRDFDPEATPAQVWSWLHGAAHAGLQDPLLRVEARMIDQIRGRDSYDRIIEAFAREPEPETPPPPDPFLRRKLRRLWPTLSEEERQTAWLVWVEDLTHEEAAAQLGITDRAVRYRLTEIIKKARRFRG